MRLRDYAAAVMLAAIFVVGAFKLGEYGYYDLRTLATWVFP